MLQTEQVLQERYHLKQLLGDRANRQTWLAEDRQTEPSQRVVLKLLPFNPQLHWEDLKLFEREAQVLQHLNHPQIPQYRDYFAINKDADGQLPWFGLVQDYIPGFSLQQLLNQKRKFTETEVIHIATQLLNLLVYLHELSPPVLHRDIKPSNIIWGEDGKVYLVDFGAVQDRATAEGATFTVVGTSGYAPPEQLWGRAVPASDLYALGATLIHLLTGTAPADLPQHKMRLQFRDQVSLNPRLAHWLEKLTDPALERRFSHARQAAEALQAYTNPDAIDISQGNRTNLAQARYGRIGGLAALQYGVLIVGITALPFFISPPRPCRECEAMARINSINQAQRTYFFNHNRFTNSVTDLQIGAESQAENYQYSSYVQGSAVFNYATPYRGGLKSYVGAVFLTQTPQNKSVTVTILCESLAPSTLRPADPFLQDQTPMCGPGTSLLLN